ncbi:MAG: membrane dipeptidase [Oleiphilaceae bacterium]|nr:membrane dipeptidase [Oleiphilaceae bacterium]
MNNKKTHALTALLASAVLLTGCPTGGDSATGEPDAATGTSGNNSGQGKGPPPGKGPTDPVDDIIQPDRFQFANGCYTLQSGQRFLAADPDNSQYHLTETSTGAARFTMRPTQLGSYLLMSDYQRATGETGTMELLGIQDPGREFLDQAGNFVGEVSFLIAGLGDTVNLAADFVLPVGDSVRSLAEALEQLGSDAGDIQVRPQLGMVTRANDLAVWQLNPAEQDRFTLESRETGLVLDPREEGLMLSSPSVASANSQFQLIEANGCEPYPEAELNATVSEPGPARYLHEVSRFDDIPGLTEKDVFGYVDTHSHISAYEFIGGRINYGDPFHRFGIPHAVEDCEVHHGPMGTTGLLEQFTGITGLHDTQGWPTFNDWPRRDSLMHHQSYYRWIERAHLGGMKLLVNHLVHNEILCQINPQKENDCDPNESIKLQIQRMYEMQNYIDAQAGGPGKGFFQIVTSPAQAREVIDQGHLAVVLGIEMSHPFGCREFNGIPQCSREQLVEDLDFFTRMGVRNMFPVHKFDNAFGGHLPDLSDGIGIGSILYGGNILSTGHPIEFEECPESFAGHLDPLQQNGGNNDSTRQEYSGRESDQEPDRLDPLGLIDQALFQMDYMGARFPESPEEVQQLDPRNGTERLCNTRGLTDFGHFMVQEMMRRGIMIETDHISRKASARILEITGKQGYPVINSHGGWGGTEFLRDRIAAQGGITADFDKTREGWVDSLIKNGTRPRDEQFMVGPFGGAGFATDVNGISALANNNGDAEDEARLYPFTSVDGRVVFDIQKTGDRAFSLYSGRGVAHYGLYPDQIADMRLHSDRPQAEVDHAINQLFTSAEAYLRMWERVEAAAR